MKARYFVLALILGISVMSTPLVNANNGGGPQDGTNSTKKCPKGYVRQGDQCVPVSPNQPINNRGVGTSDEDDMDYVLFMEIMSGMLFRLIGNI